MSRPVLSFHAPFAGRFEESRGSALRVSGRTCHMDFQAGFRQAVTGHPCVTVDHVMLQTRPTFNQSIAAVTRLHGNVASLSSLLKLAYFGLAREFAAQGR